MNSYRSLLFVTLSLLLFARTSHCAPDQTSFVIDGAGGSSSGGTLELLDACGQAGGIELSSSGSKFLQGGFLNTFSLQTSLDTDGDGLDDEADPDNDDDGLEDIREISGSAFSPVTRTGHNVADSDGDGMTDGQESVAGTNPQDEDSLLGVTVTYDNGNNEADIEWDGRGGKTYKVYYMDSPHEGFASATHLDDVSALGGSGDWMVSPTNYTDLSLTTVTQRYYFIKVEP
ncbi:MAG: thrombospondin type 3 repeat-containing protein [Verrucomicrobia bacterium]|nr:thrombospondin type 3 repeat-containing protein [Verrucomicrobiota bacterium]